MSYNFEKAKTLLITQAGVVYTSTGKQIKGIKFTKHLATEIFDDPELKSKVWGSWKNKPVVIFNTYGYYYRGFDIQQETMEYVNVLRVKIYSGSGNRVSDYKSNPTLQPGLYNWRGNVSEFRVYQNGSVTVVHSAKFSDRATPVYWVENPNYTGNSYSRYLGDTYTDEHTRGFFNETDDHGSLARIEISADDLETTHLYRYAKRNNRSCKLLHENDYIGTDLRYNVIVGMNVVDRCQEVDAIKLHPETSRMLHDFFRFGNRWDKDAIRLYGQYQRCTHKEEIETMTDLIRFTYGRTDFSCKANEEARERRNEDYLAKMQDLTFDTEHSRRLVWDRQGDEIICTIFHGSADHDWYVGDNEKTALFYNVVTKKRVLAISDNELRTISLPIPSEQIISRHMNTKPKRDYNYNTRTSTASHERYTPLLLKPFDEIFAGTNIMFLKENAPADLAFFTISLERYDHSVYVGNYSRDSYYEDDDRTANKEIRKISYQLSPEHMGDIVFRILVGSSEPWLEQCIKCGLFNIYISALSYPNYFIDKKKESECGSSYAKRNVISVVKKAKNLKKAFGMTMEQVKLLDAHIGKVQSELERKALEKVAKEENGNTWSSWEPRTAIPSLIGIEKDLGVEVNKIDLKTFQSILSLYEKDLDFTWSLHEYSFVLDVMKNCSIKQKIEYLQTSPEISHYNDYLRMRSQLKAVAEKRNDPTIYSDKQYPTKVNGGTKFFTYRVGQRVGWSTIQSESDFLDTYRYKFRDAYDRKEFATYRDNDGKLIGLLIKLNQNELFAHLHDDIQYWVTFYQDEAKQALFEKAIKRVLPLEYKDEKTQLEIIAPRGVADLKQEGTKLSHCVASFVDPIINNTENVMFIRKMDNPDCPYFTLALDNNGNIEQVHCLHNGGLSAAEQARAYERSVSERNEMTVYKEPADIVGFLQNWAKAMKGKIAKGSIRESYGALCARR